MAVAVGHAVITSATICGTCRVKAWDAVPKGVLAASTKK